MAYPNTNTTNIAFTGTSTSQVLSGKAKQITLTANAACYVSFDSTTASSTNGFYVPASQQLTFHVLYPPQISVVQSTGAGTLSVMELSDVIVGFDITVSDTYTGDSNLKTTVADTFDCDSSLLVVIADTFTGDANLTKESLSTTYTGDATINTLHEDTFSGDANLSVVYGGTFSGDSHMDV